MAAGNCFQKNLRYTASPVPNGRRTKLAIKLVIMLEHFRAKEQFVKTKSVLKDSKVSTFGLFTHTNSKARDLASKCAATEI